jgi:molecular chaperone HscC
MDPIIGIDLGTTNSAAAHLSPAGPQIIPNALGGRLTPSVVGVDEGGTVLVGAAAKELQVVRPDRCASLFKRHMGTDRTHTLGGTTFTPEELSGLVLRALKADAEAFFGVPVTRAVITCPAYFNDRQRKATIAAGRIAGLTIARILNEPTAAAIAYGFHEANQDKKLLIFDLGGGTFDVSVVELFEGTLEVRASAGETALGGEDFTRAMAARVLGGLGVPFERAEATMPLLVARLVQQCERAKCRLSREEATTVKVPDAAGELAGGNEVAVTREQLEAWVSATLARVELPVRRALGDAKLTRDRIDEVILVGGATRMPAVVKRVTDLFGKPPHQRLNPDEVVALGAAVQAGLLSRSAAVDDLVVTDVSPFTLGVEVSKRLAGQLQDGYFDPLIDRNTTIPVSRVKRYHTVVAHQTSIVFKVYQGESRRVTDNLLLGEFAVAGIPPGPAAAEAVDVRFTYDLNGVLEVEAVIVATKKKVTHVIAKHAKGMSEEQIRRAVKEMEKLKAHPREEAVNRHLLARAERVFKELPAELRQELGEVLDGFEAGLESGNPEVIARHREVLERFLSLHDPEGDDPGADE